MGKALFLRLLAPQDDTAVGLLRVRVGVEVQLEVLLG